MTVMPLWKSRGFIQFRVNNLFWIKSFTIIFFNYLGKCFTLLNTFHFDVWLRNSWYYTLLRHKGAIISSYFPCYITENYCTLMTSIIAMLPIWIEFRHFDKNLEIFEFHVTKFEFYWFTSNLDNLNQLFQCVVVEYVIVKLFLKKKELCRHSILLCLVSIH